MTDEVETGSAGAPDGKGHPRRSFGQQSPLQARTTFLKNWDWQLITSLNRGACARGGAQHGINQETQETCKEEWTAAQSQVHSLEEVLDFLRHCHRRAPFLFFNGNTFAGVGRQIAAAVFAELPTGRRREVMSAMAHYIAGVLDREPMIEIVESLCVSASFEVGDRVKTLRGSLHGVILRILDDGKVEWQPEGSLAKLTSLPESLLRASRQRPSNSPDPG